MLASLFDAPEIRAIGSALGGALLKMVLFYLAILIIVNFLRNLRNYGSASPLLTLKTSLAGLKNGFLWFFRLGLLRWLLKIGPAFMDLFVLRGFADRYFPKRYRKWRDRL